MTADQRRVNPSSQQNAVAHFSIRLVTQLFASSETLLLGTTNSKIAVCWLKVVDIEIIDT